MEKDREANENADVVSGGERALSRRDFLTSLGKWSKIVIGAAIGVGALLADERSAEAYRSAWANRGGDGGWANRGGGGAAWANRGGSGGWVNRYGGGAAWANRGGGAWANRGGVWANRGAVWVNGGGSWVNRY